MKKIDDMLTQVIRNWHDDLEVPAEASKIVRKLRADSYDELIKWLDMHAERLMQEELRRRLSGFRRDVKNQIGPKAFERWRKQAVEGKPLDPPTALNMPYAVDAMGTWKKLGDMNKSDLLFVAQQRERSANELQLQAGFLRALANRLKPGETVKDRFKVLPEAA